MSEAVRITSKDELVKRVFNLTRFEQQYPGFLKIQALRIANEKILDVIQDRMRSLGFSKKIIDRTYLEIVSMDGNGKMKLRVISDYQSESGFDVAKAREEGTRDHLIEPDVKKFLSWITQGIRYFSRGHWVRGITEHNVIEKTVDEKLPEAQEQLNFETDTLLDNLLTK